LPKSTIAIGYVHPEKVSAFFMSSLVRLLRLEGHRIEGVIAIHSGPKVDDARNQLFKEWLRKTNANRLLMVDTDMILPENTIKRLIGHNKDIVGGLCFSGGWSGTVKPVIHRVEPDENGQARLTVVYDYPPDTLMEVDGTGGACMMISRRCAEDVWRARGEDHQMPWFAYSMHNGLRIGEDIAFCLTAQKVGYKTYVDTGLEIPHVKPTTLGEVDYVRSLLNENHPHYNQRDTVPIYRELLDGDASLDSDRQSPEGDQTLRSA